jgi:hypothetical protein
MSRQKHMCVRHWPEKCKLHNTVNKITTGIDRKTKYRMDEDRRQKVAWNCKGERNAKELLEVEF